MSLNATETAEDTDEPGAGFFISPERTGRNPVTKEPDKNEGSITDKGEYSNDSWDLDTMLKDNPKMAAMMYVH